MIGPIDPFESDELNGFDVSPGSAPVDHLGLVESIDASAKALKLLYLSTGRWPGWRTEIPIDLPDDVSLDTANNLPTCFTFSRSPSRIGSRGLMVAHSDNGDPIHRSVSLPVSATVQSHAASLAAGSVM